MEHPLLERYTEEQRKVILGYWETIRWTRTTGKVAEGVKVKELEFWSKYPASIVIQALQIHIEKYHNIKEHYTHGIIRNLCKGQTYSPTPRQQGLSRKPQIEVVKSTESENEVVSDEEFAEMLKLAEKMQAKKY